MALDESVAAALAQPPWTALAPVGVVAGFAGAIYAVWAIMIVFAVGRRWRVAVPLALGLAVTEAVTFALKVAVGRLRPEGAVQVVGSLDFFSFPSGHAARAAVLFGLAVALRLRPRWALLALAFAGFVGLGRLVAQEHWLTDVLAALAIGTALGLAAGLAYDRDVAGARSKFQELLARWGIEDLSRQPAG